MAAEAGGGGSSSESGTPGGGTPANVEEVAISNLGTYLAAKPANDAGSAYKIKITGLTAANYTLIRAALRANDTKYVDLSATVLPGEITIMQQCFMNCISLVQAPVIPNGVTNMISCFYSCTSLKTVQINTTVCTLWKDCFFNCTSITSITVPDATVQTTIAGAIGNSAVSSKITIK